MKFSSLTIRKVCVSLSVVLLAGCGLMDASGLNEHQYRTDEAQRVQDQIISYRDEATGHSKVKQITQPPVNITPLTVEKIQPWMQGQVSLSLNSMPLSSVLQDVIGDDRVELWFDGEIEPYSIVSLSYQGSRKGALNQLARQTKYGFIPNGDTLEVRKFITETFEVYLPPGLLSNQIGSAESTSSGDGEEVGETTVEGQFVNIKSEDVNVFKELEEGIAILLKKDAKEDEESASNELIGDVKAIPALSKILVRTTPARMENVSRFVDNYLDGLSRQVLLNVQVLEFRSNLGTEMGIDWDVIRETSKGSLSFFLPGSDIISQGGNSGLAFAGSGKWDGSTALIKALNQQGKVSTETPINILVQNNQPNHISQVRIIEFISEIGTSSDEGVTTSDVTRDKRKEGVDFIVTPNVQRDYVYLRISGQLSKIESMHTEVVNDITLTFPEMRVANINFANKLKYGQTIVIASVSQTDNVADENTWAGIPFLGGNASQKQVVETLVLLTPRRSE